MLRLKTVNIQLFKKEQTDAILRNNISYLKGEITSCDPLFAHLHGYSSSEDVVGHYITDLIPSIQIPAPGKKIPKV